MTRVATYVLALGVGAALGGAAVSLGSPAATHDATSAQCYSKGAIGAAPTLEQRVACLEHAVYDNGFGGHRTEGSVLVARDTVWQMCAYLAHFQPVPAPPLGTGDNVLAEIGKFVCPEIYHGG